MEESQIVMKYIAAWAWQIIAVIFLATTIIASMLGNLPFIIGCGIGVGVAEFMALKRQREIYHDS